MDESNSAAERRSLTKEQLEQPEAIELLALLQTVTEDGRVLDEEVEALQEWLSLNGDSTLAGIVYLRDAVETVLADGRVTEEEREWLHEAIETVLPQEHGSAATLARMEADEDEGRSRPIARFDFMVAGVKHDGRAGVVKAHCHIEDDVFLVREPRNANSSHTIAVRLLNGMDIGYVPENDAARLSPLLDEGARLSASIKTIQEGKTTHIPVIWGELYPADSPVRHAKAMSDAPGGVKGSGAGGSNMVLFALITLVALVAAMVLLT